MYEMIRNMRYPTWNNQVFLLHMGVVLMCWTFYYKLPWISGVLVSPYLIFLIIKPRQEYLIPLILHTWYGSQQRYFILAVCFLYALFHYRQMQTLGVQILFSIYLLFIPFFIWYTCARISAFHSFLTGGIYEGISYYFSFAPFFWAALSFRHIDKHVYRWLMFVSFLIVLKEFVSHGSEDNASLSGISIFGYILTYTRFHSWGSVYMVVACFWAFVTKQSTQVKMISAFAALLFVLGFFHIGRTLIPFHLAGAAALGAFIILCGRYSRRYPVIFHPWIFLIVATFSVFLAIERFEKRKADFERVNYNKIRIHNMDDFILRLENKLYADRAPLWAASKDAVRQQIAKSWFFVNPHGVVGEIMRDDGYLVGIDMQAHNMFLELLRLYGIFGGGGLLLTFYLLVGLKRMRNSAINLKSPCAPIAAAAIGHIVFGYWGGQYLLTPTFSFTLYALIGICYRNQFEDERPQINVRGWT